MAFGGTTDLMCFDFLRSEESVVDKTDAHGAADNFFLFGNVSSFCWWRNRCNYCLNIVHRRRHCDIEDICDRAIGREKSPRIGFDNLQG